MAERMGFEPARAEPQASRGVPETPLNAKGLSEAKDIRQTAFDPRREGEVLDEPFCNGELQVLCARSRASSGEG